MEKNLEIFIAMPRLFLGDPTKTVEEFSVLLKEANLPEDATLIYPADAILGDIGHLRLSPDLQEARDKAERDLSMVLPSKGGLSLFPHLEDEACLAYRDGVLLEEIPIKPISGLPAIAIAYGEKKEHSLIVAFNRTPDFLGKEELYMSRIDFPCLVVGNDGGESSGGGSFSGKIYSNIPSVPVGGRRIFAYNIPHKTESGLPSVSSPYVEFEKADIPPALPFLPHGGSYENIVLKDVEEAFSILASSLSRRLERIGTDKVVLGLSGGLDSTLTLFVALEALKNGSPAMEEGCRDLKQHIFLYSLPCFGTSKTTLRNVGLLSKATGIPVKEISIKESVLRHFQDIEHDPSITNSAFENAQARERTQVLMDIANDVGALMIGTGDMSELALGWTTFGGDHLSMYDTNAGATKTMVRYLCLGYAKMHPEFEEAVRSIIGTPVSPELLPTDKEGAIAQKTEEALGPYEVMDYFLYGFLSDVPLASIFEKACRTFADQYDAKALKRWLGVFVRRFVNQSFKRNCLCDGPQLVPFFLGGSGYRFPSDVDPSFLLRLVEAL